MNRRTGSSETHDLVMLWRGSRDNPGTGSLADPFAVNPIRRSFALVVGCLLILVVPWMISEAAVTTVMLSVGWLAVTGLVMGLPVLGWSIAADVATRVRRHFHPSVDRLDISPRLVHVLERHGYSTIESVDTAPDIALLMLSNMDARGIREIRRATALWKYQRWQERGYPVAGR